MVAASDLGAGYAAYHGAGSADALAAIVCRIRPCRKCWLANNVTGMQPLGRIEAALLESRSFHRPALELKTGRSWGGDCRG